MDGSITCPKCEKKVEVMSWQQGEFKLLPEPFKCGSCSYEFAECDYEGTKCKGFGGIKHPVYVSDVNGFPTDEQITKYACLECEFEFFDND